VYTSNKEYEGTTKSNLLFIVAIYNLKMCAEVHFGGDFLISNCAVINLSFSKS